MKVRDALKITGSLSKPSKMPGWAYGLPAKECKTGGKLQKVKGSVCYDCYAMKGCYVFKVVQRAQYYRLNAIKNSLWPKAMSMIINSKKSKFFRWHDSGDVQNLEHLLKIYEVCKLTPSVKHWMPTREAWVKGQAIQASSSKLQGPSTKLQAPSRKQQDHGPRTLHKVLRSPDRGAQCR
jgi:hypothetical protein